ncbi:hypothetical protein AMELA_G00004130 [Ameiurus melas]|uniref:Uncharacterized protein n=1 Tax=Ameiurus melas TaxID=219545 RepID=A0A7J6BIQ0_AMEME|nr:hypothetical protein AMELA_G00004130 [Ameiurus melas]
MDPRPDRRSSMCTSTCCRGSLETSRGTTASTMSSRNMTVKLKTFRPNGDRKTRWQRRRRS